MSEEEIRRYLASIGSKGGKAGTGGSKLRGGKEYYRRISKLAAKARQTRRTEANKKHSERRKK
jgi:hypothetical protein